ncbi:MAG: aminodeoxychorismate synthase component I [Rhodospirillales bacterium]|nr:aminodeoxychorismate synthase component I [Rhodospirillales bacterium]
MKSKSSRDDRRRDEKANSRDGLILLDDTLQPDGGCWLLEHPDRVVVCHAPDDLDAALTVITQAVAKGRFAAGFFAYELGYLLEPALAPLLPLVGNVPLLWIGIFASARRLSARETREWLHMRATGEAAAVRDLRLTWDRDTYRAAFAQVDALIAAGDVYQINLTLKYRFTLEGDPTAFYAELRRRQRVACGGLIEAPGLRVLSISPELFFKVDDGLALVRPMKGTAARGVTPLEDARQRDWLADDEKSRAENLMIVDLMRNDIGRLAETGGVRVTDLFTVETYRSLHQMTSGVTARLRPGVDLRALLRALFPCGSVTGAPKIRAMQIIRALETEARGIYTGAIGMVFPDGRCFFNVAIRTLVLDDRGHGEMGIGSGIVADSNADAEYDECLLKARFLTETAAPMGLIETLRWQHDAGYFLLDSHIRRLIGSAAFFGIPCDGRAIRSALKEAACSLGDGCWRVRLVLDEDGEISVESAPLLPRSSMLRYALAGRPVFTRDPLLYHKTTRRDAYDEELKQRRAECACDEVLFVNERGELTEGTWTNLFVRRDGRLLTPPVSCGLLDGTLRRALLDAGDGTVVEAVLYPEDLAGADAVLLGNSVRGLMPARPSSPSSSGIPQEWQV